MASKNPKIPEPFEIEINRFRTLNTKDSPVTMKDDEMPLLVNFMPVGTSLYTIPGPSADLCTLGSQENIWTSGTVKALNAVVVPTIPNGCLYRVTANGTTGGAEPIWPTNTGDTVTDGGVTWECRRLDITHMFDAYISGTAYKIVMTAGGILWKLDASWNQTKVFLAGDFTLFSNPKFEQWKTTPILIIDSTGYFTYDGTTLTKLTATNAPTKGTAIAIYQGRVWIVYDVRTVVFSAPDSYTDFQTASGGGSLIDNYSDLRRQINALVPTSDYLYVIGDHATHIISNIQILQGTTTTLYNLIDSLPGIGSVYPDTVSALGPLVYMMGDTGINAVSAGAYQIFSTMLDGIMPNIQTDFTPIAFFANIYNKLVYCILLKVKDPITSEVQKQFWCFYEDRWFIMYLGNTIDVTCAMSIKSATDTKTYGAHGNSIFQFFTGDGIAPKRFRTKSFDLGTAFYDKQILKVGIMAQSFGQSFAITPTITAKGNIGDGTSDVLLDPGAVVWVNAQNQTVQWGNATWEQTWVELFGMKTVDGCRGKRVSFEYSETSALLYIVTGLIIEGQYGADR